MKKLLGTNTLPSGDAIIESSRSGTNYFARGHLSPDAAFIYDAEQDATYYFMNVAPQFQSFNNGNWKSLEMATRKYAEEKAKGDVKVNSDFRIKSLFIDLSEFLNFFVYQKLHPFSQSNSKNLMWKTL